MLVIRQAQLEAFRQDALQDFQDRLQRHLERTLAGTHRSFDAVGAMRSALALGISRECDIARFSELLYRQTGDHLLGGLPPKAQNRLLAHGVPAAERLDQLEAWASSLERKTPSGG